jgi:hypothetical protein
MKPKYLFLLLFVLILSACSSNQNEFNWPESTVESKPWTRWWWMGNAVDEQNISRELNEMAEMGIGGVEITPIYGVKGEEDRFIEYLTPEFSEILKYTIEEAHKLEMEVDLPPGSGWRCGAPFVPEEKGLWALRMHKQPLQKGETAEIPAGVTVAAVSFKDENGEITVFNPEEKFTAPANGMAYFAERRKNRDMVKRASDGGKGWAIDTFNEDITEWYLQEFWTRLNIPEGLIRSFFHDSFEYTGDFTTHFTEEFQKRRGYNLAEYLHVLAGDCEDNETIARVKSDYRETLSDLVLESFIEPMTGWAHSHQSLNRNQAHGSPGNILDLYAASDIPETEIFRTVEPGTVDVFVNKFASSSAHVTGQQLVSSESYTWLDEHWTVTTTDMMRATNRFFLAGINHMFFHGTCYSPEDAEWPGWLFYASTQVNNRNPLWREMPALFKYIERSQSVLQKATPQNDLLIYWPYYDVAASRGPIFNHLGVNKDAGWFKSHPISGLSERLMKAGYTFNYISDKQLHNCEAVDGEIITSGKSKYKAIVVPKTTYMPVGTMEKLVMFIAEGGKVYFDEILPETVPGISNLEDRTVRLTELKLGIANQNVAGNILELLLESGIEGEKSIPENGLNFIKMKLDDEIVYMVFNCGLSEVDTWVTLSETAKYFVCMNPYNGEITVAENKKNAVRIQLEPERSVFIRCTDSNPDLPNFIYRSDEAVEIEGLWKINFVDGGPVYPGNISTDNLKSWTEMGDNETSRFSGTARYTLEFGWSNNSKSAFLDLGDVRDCAHVFLNGKDVGSLLGPDFSLKVNNLQQGKNELVVEVTNVAANRIRDLDIRGVDWKKFHDINFVNIDYRPFDASDWEIREAGLLGPVTFHPVEK